MSENFCILIPSKVFQVEKRFPEKLQAWIVTHRMEFYYDSPNLNYSDSPNLNYRLPNYSLLTLSEFRERPDVHLDLPEKMYSRYHAIDWGFYFMESHILQFFLSWLAEIYVYGEVGLLNYWSDERRRSPPVTVGNIEESISTLAASELPLNKLLFFPLTNYSS